MTMGDAALLWILLMIFWLAVSTYIDCCTVPYSNDEENDQ